MAHYGILSLHLTGHLNSAMAVARGLEERGHQVTFFSMPDVEDALSDFGFRMVAFGEDLLPKGSLRELANRQALLKEEEAFSSFLDQMMNLAKLSYRDLPSRIMDRQIDVLLVDQLFPGGATVAEHLGLPYVSIASAVPINRSESLPPPNLGWDYEPTPEGRERDRTGWDAGREAFSRWTDVENAQRKKWRLRSLKDVLEDSFSPFAQIAQIPEIFDFPRDDTPSNLVYVGPLNHPETRSRVDFPWDRLDGRPILYASLGTMQNGLEWVFRTILEATAGLEFQLVMSTGGGPVTGLTHRGTLHNAIVVNYAPQFELLSKASLCITHAGLNTTLEALSHGVPLVAIPITHDQPGVAARIRWTQCGQSIDLSSLTPASLREAIRTVSTARSYRRNAIHFRDTIAKLTPIKTACELIEELTITGHRGPLPSSAYAVAVSVD